MEIENITALLKERVYEQSLESTDVDASDGTGTDVAPQPNPHQHLVDFPWLDRQPFSPPTMGCPLPYLDVISIQSKRLLPISRKELDAHRRNLKTEKYHHHAKRKEDDTPAVDDNGDASDNDRFISSASLGEDTWANKRSDSGPVDFDAILRSIRLLVEPIAIPDLSHTGVKWQYADRAQDIDNIHEFHVTAPNHSFDETQVKLFYPTGAKNSNMREYIKDTIQKHMAGASLLPNRGESSPPHKAFKSLADSQSLPALVGENDEVLLQATSSPSKSNPKKKLGRHSPTKTSSPKKAMNGSVSSGARLSGSISTSKLLNPELTRQAKDILAQIRANSNKINDLIGP